MMKCLGSILLVLTVPVMLAAQAAPESGVSGHHAHAAHDAWVGTWKLNVAKSKFDPGPPMQNQTVTIAADGKVSVEGTESNGQAQSWSYVYSEGTEVPISGVENSSVTEKRTPRTVEHAWKMGNAHYTGKGVLSRNGKVMTYTYDGTNDQGQHVHDVLVYDKQ